MIVGGAGGASYNVVTGSLDSPIGIIGAALAVVGVFTIAADLREVHREGTRYAFRPVKDVVNLDQIRLSDRYAGFSAFVAAGGAAVRSPALDLALWDGLDRRFSLDERLWELPRLPSRLLPSIMSQRQRTTDIVFDAKKVSLRTDLTVAALAPHAPRIHLQHTTYFRGEVTNELTGRIVTELDTGVTVYDGISMVVTDGVLRDLEESQLSNHIGGSSLAFTSDGSLIVTRQSAESAKEPNNLAPSGSGSADLADARDCTTIGELALRSINRELTEECGVGEEMIASRLCGYARILQRGGKPDFFAISRMSKPASALRVRSHERAFVDSHQVVPVDLEDADRLRASLRSIPDRLEGVPSFVLLLALRIVDDLLAERPDEVLAFLRGA